MENLNINHFEAEIKSLNALIENLRDENMRLKNDLEYAQMQFADTNHALRNMQNRCLLLDGMVRAFECILNKGENILSTEV